MSGCRSRGDGETEAHSLRGVGSPVVPGHLGPLSRDELKIPDELVAYSVATFVDYSGDGIPWTDRC